MSSQFDPSLINYIIYYNSFDLNSSHGSKTILLRQFLHVYVIEEFMFQVDEGAPSKIERLRA